ncbi:hypothetical protein SEN110799_27460 [Salmonella enterica subsp. enterica serovar Kentucky]|nr:hypothetical protein SEN1985_01770 [Salmonella enterica subsp. enterica serovar Kentucky]CAH2867885.1 hypothetical protein SEN110799_27460 [Salmonella enterica subsp. enterica serovar Kentucky]
MTIDGAIDDVARHELGKAGGITLLVFITGGKNLSRSVIHQHPGACINGWRLGSKTYGIGRKRRRKVHRE